MLLILFGSFNERKSEHEKWDKTQTLPLASTVSWLSNYLRMSAHFDYKRSANSAQVEEGERTAEVGSDTALESELMVSLLAVEWFFIHKNCSCREIPGEIMGCCPNKQQSPVNRCLNLLLKLHCSKQSGCHGANNRTLFKMIPEIPLVFAKNYLCTSADITPLLPYFYKL